MTGWDTLTTLKYKKGRKKNPQVVKTREIYVRCLDPRVWDEMLITQSVNTIIKI